MKKTDDVHNGRSFLDIARELGCDPDDPRVAEVLRAMAAQRPKPRAQPSGDKAPSQEKKRLSGKHP